MTPSLVNINTWRLNLGLLPVPLFNQQKNSSEAFIMLNGSHGNFCLSPNIETLNEATRNYSWSSDVGYYVGIANDNVQVQRWDRGSIAIETYSEHSVRQNLDKFHSFLEANSPRREHSVVTHSIKVYRMLRASLGRDFDGHGSLQAFLYLLASISENQQRGSINLATWGLSIDAQQIAFAVSDSDWEQLILLLTDGQKKQNLNLEVDLMLRHATGRLFQEAHYEALFSNQLSFALPGFAPTPIQVSSQVRKSSVHYTPLALVRTIVEETLSDRLLERGILSILDPACGSGEFLREAIRQLGLKNYSGKLKIVGWDVSPVACDIARFAIQQEARNAPFHVEIDIRYLDALDEQNNWPSNVNVILMNPPFISISDLGKKQEQDLKRVLGETAKFRSDYSFAFLKKAVQTLSDGGVLGSIVPISFLDGDSASRLRGEIAENTHIQLIAKLGNQSLFSRATVDAAIYVTIKDSINRQEYPSPIVFWSDYRSESSSAGARALRKLRYDKNSWTLPVINDGFSIYENTNLGKDNSHWTPRPYDAWKLLNSLAHMETVGDIFDIRQGARTGNNSVFIIDRAYWQSLPQKEQVFFRPAVVNASVTHCVLQDVKYIFFPHGKNKFDVKAELNDKITKFFHERLLPNRTKLSQRARSNQRIGGLVRKRDPPRSEPYRQSQAHRRSHETQGRAAETVPDPFPKIAMHV